LGVPQDFVRAYMWTSLGATAGDSKVSENRDRLTKQMTPAQLAEAQKLARDCQGRRFKGCD